MNGPPSALAAHESTLAKDESATRAAASYRITAWIATLLFGAISGAALAGAPLAGPPGYRYSFAFLTPLVWVVYFARRRLDVSPLHFALFASLLLLHDLGAFGCYTRYYLGLQFDWYVHFYGGLVGGLFVARAGARHFGLRGWRLVVVVALVVTGVGGIHEIIEGMSTFVLGKSYGMLKIDGDPFDTPEDLLNNLLGSLVAVGANRLWVRRREGD
jgi:uncharacterized membrane protein YjdF